MASRARQGWQALVTRPREEAETLVQTLAGRSVQALVEPLMQIHFLEAAPDLLGVQAVLCTSANGVKALARTGADKGVPVFAVGDATAARAREAGFTRVESAGGNSLDLAQLVARRLQPSDGRLLYVSGRDVAGNLVEALHQRGFATERSVLYQARPVAALSAAAVHALSAGEIDFALFFSPRTAEIFVRLADAAGVGAACDRVTALSISAAADAELGKIAWYRRRIAERPDQRALLCLLDGLLAKERRD
jgi:uroporphyrinogen-III synthase